MSIGKMYSASFEKVSVTADQDAFQLLAPAGIYVIVHALYLSQSSDVGDAAAESLNVLIHYGSTNGSGGSTHTPTPLYLPNGAAGTVVEINNDTPATQGTFVHADSMNIALGLQLVWAEQCRPIIVPGDLFHVTLQENPGDALTMNGTIYFEEVRKIYPRQRP